VLSVWLVCAHAHIHTCVARVFSLSVPTFLPPPPPSITHSYRCVPRVAEDGPKLGRLSVSAIWSRLMHTSIIHPPMPGGRQDRVLLVIFWGHTMDAVQSTCVTD